MSDAERIAHLERELEREREEKSRLLAVIESLTAPKQRSNGAERQARYRARHASTVTQGVTSDVTVTRHTPPTPPLDGSPLSSTPSLPSPLSSPHPLPAPQGAAVASPEASGEELPDVTHHAEECPVEAPGSPVDARNDTPEGGSSPPFALVAQKAGKAARKPSAAERLYTGLEEARRERCESALVEYIPEGWAPQRINKQLGPLAKAMGPEADRLNDAFAEFLYDERGVDFDPPWSLGMFLVCRSQYESKAARAAGGAA